MIRSFAMTFSAVTLRIYMPLAGVLGFDLMRAYPAIAWLCWVPNAILAELYLGKGGASSAVAAIVPSFPSAAPIAAQAYPLPRRWCTSMV